MLAEGYVTVELPQRSRQFGVFRGLEQAPGRYFPGRIEKKDDAGVRYAAAGQGARLGDDERRENMKTTT